MLVGIVGSRGRLGSALSAACRTAGIPVVAEADRTGLTESGRPTIVFDTSSSSALPGTIALVSRWQAALIYCVSVVPPEHRRLLAHLADRFPVLLATNLSPGHYLQTRLTAQLATLVAKSELTGIASIRERHPRTKRDRPSASALELAEVWQGHGSAEPGEIVSLRHGPVVSEHRVSVDFVGESITIAHDVSDLAAAAAGGLLLAARAEMLPPGLITAGEVFDVLLGGRA